MTMWNVWIRHLTTLFARLTRAPRHGAGVPASLLERADACAGRDPQGAADLRAAALNYLGVVR